MNPVLPGSSNSNRPRTSSLRTTGAPDSIASQTTSGQGSYSEGSTNKSAARNTAGSLDWLTNPNMRTRPEMPSAAASVSTAARRGPSPAYTRQAFGTSALAKARSTSSGRFQG